VIKVSSFIFEAVRAKTNSQINDFILSATLRNNQTKQDESNNKKQ